MNPQVQYKLSLLGESMQISGQFLLIRLHLKQVSEEEIDRLRARSGYIQMLLKEAQK
jgi:hypothetical protein